MKSKYDYRHILLINAGSLLIAFVPVFAKLIPLPPLQLVFFRSLMAGIFLGLFLKIRKVSIFRSFGRHPLFFIGTGILLGVHWVFLFWAVKISTVSVAILSVFTFPVMTTLLEPLFFKMKMVWFNLLTAGFILIGVSFLVPEFSLENHTSLGVLFGLIAALLISIRNLLCKKYIDEIDSSEMMFFQVLVAALFLIPTLVIAPIQLTPVHWIYLVILSLVATAFAHTLLVYCLKFFHTSTASVIISIEPFYSILLAMLILGEYPEVNILVGGSIVVGTVLLENLTAGYRSRWDKTPMP